MQKTFSVALLLVLPSSSVGEESLSPKALFMTVWCPNSRSVESNGGIPRG